MSISGITENWILICLSQIFLALHNIEGQVKENSTMLNIDNERSSANDTYLIQTLGPNSALSQPYGLNLTDETLKMYNISHNLSTLQDKGYSSETILPMQNSTIYYVNNSARNLARLSYTTSYRQMDQTTKKSMNENHIDHYIQTATRKFKKAYFVTSPPPIYHMYHPLGKPHW